MSFEQRLIGDEDFCRRCWDEIMNATPHEDEGKEEKEVSCTLVAEAEAA